MFPISFVFARINAGNNSLSNALPPEICILFIRNLSKSLPPSSSTSDSAAIKEISVKCSANKESIFPSKEVLTTDAFKFLLFASREIFLISSNAFLLEILNPLMIIEG